MADREFIGFLFLRISSSVVKNQDDKSTEEL